MTPACQSDEDLEALRWAEEGDYRALDAAQLERAILASMTFLSGRAWPHEPTALIARIRRMRRRLVEILRGQGAGARPALQRRVVVPQAASNPTLVSSQGPPSGGDTGGRETRVCDCCRCAVDAREIVERPHDTRYCPECWGGIGGKRGSGFRAQTDALIASQFAPRLRDLLDDLARCVEPQPGAYRAVRKRNGRLPPEEAGPWHEDAVSASEWTTGCPRTGGGEPWIGRW